MMLIAEIRPGDIEAGGSIKLHKINMGMGLLVKRIFVNIQLVGMDVGTR